MNLKSFKKHQKNLLKKWKKKKMLKKNHQIQNQN